MTPLHANQQKILDFLLDHHEGATLDEIASHLALSKTAAKEHLIKIERFGYLTFTDSKGDVGRPRRRYQLSQEGMDAFPKQYSWLSNVLLEMLAETSKPSEIARMMEALADKVSRSMEPKINRASTNVERLQLMTQILNELGYRSRLKQSDLRKGAVIEATNCVYHAVAKEHPVLCRFDIRFIEKVTKNMDVKLESCIARGDSVCRFCLKRKPVSG